MKYPQKKIWNPSSQFIENSNLRNFERWLGKYKGLSFSNYSKLWKWSTEHIEDFWESIWQYFDIISHSEYNSILTEIKMPGARWFSGSTLNYVEHIFRHKNNERPALYFKNEKGVITSLTWQEIEEKAANLQQFLLESGIKNGDRIAGYMPNIPEAIIIFMATCSLGAIWTCASSDFGAKTVIDRFKQVKPKLLFSTDGYHYNGKANDRIEEVKQIQEGVPSIEKVILIPYLNEEVPSFRDLILWDEVSSGSRNFLEFTPLDFDHPIWILYSSGTTGKPKAITHSHGGVLLEHLKYLSFHNNVKPGEVFFWFTTTGWMMWNFLPASMLAGAIPLLFEGNPGYPNFKYALVSCRRTSHSSLWHKCSLSYSLYEKELKAYGQF